MIIMMTRVMFIATRQKYHDKLAHKRNTKEPEYFANHY